MSVLALIQARCGSSRLPGKVLKEVGGKSLLEHQLSQISYCKSISEIAVLTTNSPVDDSIEKFCQSKEVNVFRGDEEDVLKRFTDALETFRSGNTIVRLTADCPLIDPVVIDLVAGEHLKVGADYTSNTLERTFPRGYDCEFVEREILMLAGAEASEGFQREHVTPYIYENKEKFKLHSVRNPLGNHSDVRVTVDTEEDFLFVSEIIDRIASSPLLQSELLKILDSNPELVKINSEVIQRAIR